MSLFSNTEIDTAMEGARVNLAPVLAVVATDASGFSVWLGAILGLCCLAVAWYFWSRDVRGTVSTKKLVNIWFFAVGAAHLVVTMLLTEFVNSPQEKGLILFFWCITSFAIFSIVCNHLLKRI